MLQILKKRKKGQSTLEYMVLVAMVIAILVVFLRPEGIFGRAYNRTLQQGTDGMEILSNRLTCSHTSG